MFGVLTSGIGKGACVRVGALVLVPLQGASHKEVSLSGVYAGAMCLLFNAFLLEL